MKNIKQYRLGVGEREKVTNQINITSEEQSQEICQFSLFFNIIVIFLKNLFLYKFLN